MEPDPRAGDGELVCFRRLLWIARAASGDWFRSQPETVGRLAEQYSVGGEALSLSAIGPAHQSVDGTPYGYPPEGQQLLSRLGRQCDEAVDRRPYVPGSLHVVQGPGP